MINPANEILKAFYDLLAGNISVPVYRIEAPPEETGHYVLIRKESDSEPRSNNHLFFSQPVVITEIVTRFETRIDDGVAHEIDSEIASLLLPTPPTTGLTGYTGIQITGVQRRDQQDLMEQDNTYKYYSIITRNVVSVAQS